MQISLKRDNILLGKNDEGWAVCNSDGSSKITRIHGSLFEPSLGRNIFSYSIFNTTSSATNGFLGTGPLVGIYNPAGSGINCSILEGYCHMSSGTAAAGGVVWGVCPQQTNGTMTSIQSSTNCLGTLSNCGSMVTIFTLSTTTQGLSSSIFLRNLAGGGAFASAVAATTKGRVQYDRTDGSIICPPGNAVGIYKSAAGSSSVYSATLVWEEIPVVYNLL